MIIYVYEKNLVTFWKQAFIMPQYYRQKRNEQSWIGLLIGQSDALLMMINGMILRDPNKTKYTASFKVVICTYMKRIL